MDYCTFFPEGWWSSCCETHDTAYDAGVDRLGADLDLLMCVATSGGEATLLGIASALIGATMFVGVRLFGWRFFKRASKTT